MMEKTEQLQWAITKWAEAAISGAANPDYAASCDRTVKALQLELKTGVSHCNCHLSAECPSKIDTSRTTGL